MSEKFTRRNVMLSLAAAAAASQVPGTATSEEPEGHGIEREGATLNRFATTVIGGEITGMFLTADGRFFFNVQHPDANLDGTDEPGTLGAVTGTNMNQLPGDFQSVQIPEGDDDDYGDGDGKPEPYWAIGDPDAVRDVIVFHSTAEFLDDELGPESREKWLTVARGGEENDE